MIVIHKQLSLERMVSTILKVGGQRKLMFQSQIRLSKNWNTKKCNVLIKISRFIKKIEKDDKFLSSCLALASAAEHNVKQNSCVDIYRDYFNYEDDATNERRDDLRIIAEFPDPVGRRPVSGVSWCPDGGSTIAISYCSPIFLGSTHIKITLVCNLILQHHWLQRSTVDIFMTLRIQQSIVLN